MNRNRPSNRRRAEVRQSPRIYKLMVEHAITVDMDDGQPLPPFIEDGVLWGVVNRANGTTKWRRITLQTTEWSGDATLDDRLHSPSVDNGE
jgi:hypothetical protein